MMVLVDDEVCERVREGAIGMEEVADGNGELNDPDIPERLKKTNLLGSAGLQLNARDSPKKW